MTTQELETSLGTYSRAVAAGSHKTAKALGYGAVALGSLFTAADADAEIVYSGVLNVGFVLSTINASSTNRANGFYFASATSGRNVMGMFGNNRGPANTIGSTDIVWLAGATAANGAIKANGTTFPASAVPFASTSFVDSAGSAASFVWADAGVPGNNVIDPFGVGNSGTVTAFFGFSFDSLGAAGRNFGWGRIELTTRDGQPDFAFLVDFAYESTPNLAIQVGDVGAIPEPGSLAGLSLLAMGCMGLRRYRKEEM